MIRVRYLGPLSALVGAPVMDYDLPRPLTVEELIGQLAARHGERLREAVLARTREGSLFYQVLINGRNMFTTGGLQATVQPGDEVLISIPLSGG